MSLLDTASLILTPNGYKADKLYSVKPTDASGDMVVSRGTTATRVNSAGLIESVATNVPRLDYTGGGCPRILVEPARTNLVFPSATLTTQTRTVTAVAHTLSFYGTGTIVLSGVHIATLTGTGANNRVTLTFTPTAGSLILTVAGTVTNAQLEAGSTATSYIPTTISSLTRNADIITRNNIFTNGLITTAGGTWFVELSNNLPRARDSQSFFGVGDTNALTLNSLVLIPSVSGRFIVFKIIGGTSFTSLFTTTTDTCKIAIKWNGVTANVFQNGVNVVVNTPFTPTNMNFLGNPNVGVSFFINQMALFPTPLTDIQCISLTTL